MTDPIVLPSGATVQVSPPAVPAVQMPAPGPTNTMVLPVPGIQGLQGIRGLQGIQGIQGLPGLSGANVAIVGEVPTGPKDGVNLTFALNNAFQVGSTRVFRNGIRELLGAGYTESSPNIIFSVAPLSTDAIEVDYLIA